MKTENVGQTFYVREAIWWLFTCLFTFNSFFIIVTKKKRKKNIIGVEKDVFLLPAGQVCLHPLLCHEVRYRFISWGPLLIHIWSLPSNPATAVVEQHHSECTSISERTGCVMLIVVSIALGVYPQDTMKPYASELFSSLLLLKAKSMWALEEKDILRCMCQPINTVKECKNTVYYYLLCDCGDKKMF